MFEHWFWSSRNRTCFGGNLARVTCEDTAGSGSGRGLGLGLGLGGDRT